MGTQALWHTQSPFPYATEQSGPGSVSPAANIYHELEFRGFNILVSPHKNVPVGPDFQAELPQLISEKNDGQLVVPASSPRNDEAIWPQAACTFVSKGDMIKCSCVMHNSAECIRHHIQHKRKRLHDELGKAFYEWGFDEMGEVVAEHWPMEEQLIFQNVVRQYPSSFWPRLYEALPSRSTRDLVSYYFNVYVLQQRALQNRLDPNNIDSDDDYMVINGNDEDNASMYESDVEANESQVDDGDGEEDSRDHFMEDDSMVEHAQDRCEAVADVNVDVARALLLVPADTSSDKSHGDADVDALENESKRGCIKHEDNSSDIVLHIMALEDSTSCKNMESDHSLDSCEVRAWESPILCSPHVDVDKLLSTKKMMEEFFGAGDFK